MDVAACYLGAWHGGGGQSDADAVPGNVERPLPTARSGIVASLEQHGGVLFVSDGVAVLHSRSGESSPALMVDASGYVSGHLPGNKHQSWKDASSYNPSKQGIPYRQGTGGSPWTFLSLKAATADPWFLLPHAAPCIVAVAYTHQVGFILFIYTPRRVNQETPWQSMPRLRTGL